MSPTDHIQGKDMDSIIYIQYNSIYIYTYVVKKKIVGIVQLLKSSVSIIIKSEKEKDPKLKEIRLKIIKSLPSFLDAIVEFKKKYDIHFISPLEPATDAIHYNEEVFYPSLLDTNEKKLDYCISSFEMWEKEVESRSHLFPLLSVDHDANPSVFVKSPKNSITKNRRNTADVSFKMKKIKNYLEEYSTALGEKDVYILECELDVEEMDYELTIRAWLFGSWTNRSWYFTSNEISKLFLVFTLVGNVFFQLALAGIADEKVAVFSGIQIIKAFYGASVFNLQILKKLFRNFEFWFLFLYVFTFCATGCYMVQNRPNYEYLVLGYISTSVITTSALLTDSVPARFILYKKIKVKIIFFNRYIGFVVEELQLILW